MTYVALLRGINVGGNNKIAMTELKAVFKAIGCKNVITYINSGNVVFSDLRSANELHSVIESALASRFGYEIKVLIVDKPALDQIAAALPATWHNNEIMKCDIMFLWHEKNTPTVVQGLPAKLGIDNIKYVNGALIWSVLRSQVTKSGLAKLIGTDLYKKMTIRNVNTFRKLLELTSQQEDMGSFD